MPLQKGATREVINANIRYFKKQGYDRYQAVKLAMKEAGKSLKKGKRYGGGSKSYQKRFEFLNRQSEQPE